MQVNKEMLGYGVYLLTVFCGFCNKIFFEKQQYQDNLKPVSIGVTSTYTKNLRSNFVPTICIFAVFTSSLKFSMPWTRIASKINNLFPTTIKKHIKTNFGINYF
jgi:hypothetical protein